MTEGFWTLAELGLFQDEVTMREEREDGGGVRQPSKEDEGEWKKVKRAEKKKRARRLSVLSIWDSSFLLDLDEERKRCYSLRHCRPRFPLSCWGNNMAKDIVSRLQHPQPRTLKPAS
jgi:hypothetical protein